MREKIKSQKGISMITLALAVTIILIITGILIYKSNDGIKIKKIQDLYNDISTLREKISTYYLKYGTTPNYTEYTEISNLRSANVIGANDIGKFYVIDLEKLDAITLTYGIDFERIKNGNYENLRDFTDLYIINETSHNIFYVQGIENEGKKYYTDQKESDSIRLDPRVVEGITIPEGFHYVGGNKDNGLVISDVADDDLQNSQGGNQFVWVPVENPDEMYGQLTDGKLTGKLYDFSSGEPKPLNWSEENKTMTVNSNEYREPFYQIASYENEQDNLNIIKNILTDQQENYSNGANFNETIQEDIDGMIVSVKENKGFFIGRFETSLDANGKAQSKKNKTPATAQNSSANTWYGFYAKQKDFATGKNGIVSSMVWGSQYDAMLKWALRGEDYNKITENENGNHTGTVSQTGTYNNGSDIINNIYDLEGNLCEWTLESADDNLIQGRSGRGGWYNSSGGKVNPTHRSTNNVGTNSTATMQGSRMTLFIKGKNSKEFKKRLLEISTNIENINTSAKVSNINGKILTIDSTSLKVSNAIGNFEKDDEVILYVSNSNTTTNCRKI